MRPLVFALLIAVGPAVPALVAVEAHGGTVYTYAAQGNDEGVTDFSLSVSDGVTSSDFAWDGLRQDYGALLLEDVGGAEPTVKFVSLGGGFTGELALPFELLGDAGTLYVDADWLTDLDPVSTSIPSVVNVGMASAQVNTLSGRIEWRGESMPFDVVGDFCGVSCERSATWELDGPPIPFPQARLPNGSFYSGGTPSTRVSGFGMEWTVEAAHTTQPQGSAGYNLIPEPSTALLLTFGLVGITAGWGRRTAPVVNATTDE